MNRPSSAVQRSCHGTTLLTIRIAALFERGAHRKVSKPYVG